MTLKLVFVCDGHRDVPCVPRLVERILGVPVEEDCRSWARLNDKSSARVKGFARKIRFAIRQARDARAAGLVATIDCDKAPSSSRLRELQEGRDLDRQENPPFPTALGEADPHFEVWLLDDAVAVRSALNLRPDHPIPNIRDLASPKATIDEIVTISGRCLDPPSRIELLAEIACRVETSRCQHDGETGFKRFVEEVRQELGPSAASLAR